MPTRYENGPPGYPYDHTDHGFYGRRARVAVQHASDYARPYLRTRRLGAMSVGATAMGALALGAVAIGALAISRLAINKMGVRNARIGTLEIDELRVRRLRVDRQDGPEAMPRYAAMRRAG